MKAFIRSQETHVAIAKRLVIELGYLEHCFAEGLQDPNVQTAAAGIDTAIDCLNEHLAS